MHGFKVDEKLCVQCGLCVEDCVFGAIELDGIPIMTNPDSCIKCQHCLAVCPTGALSVLGNSPDDSTLIKGEMPSADQMAVLIKGRRSIRRYKPDPLESAQIQKLLDIAWHAPTGVNSQSVHITLMESAEDVKAFSDYIYSRIEKGFKNNSLPDLPIVRYYEWALKARERGIDMLFRSAPHVIIVSSPKSAPTSVADTHIFLSYFELMAQAMGIGTLWNGLLRRTVEVVFPDLLEKLGIPDDHEISYAMSFGIPDVKYQRTIERGPANIRRIGWKG